MRTRFLPLLSSMLLISALAGQAVDKSDERRLRGAAVEHEADDVAHRRQHVLRRLGDEDPVDGALSLKSPSTERQAMMGAENGLLAFRANGEGDMKRHREVMEL